MDRVLAEQVHAPFHLRNGPLTRAKRVRLLEEVHVSAFTVQHVVFAQPPTYAVTLHVRDQGRVWSCNLSFRGDRFPAARAEQWAIRFQDLVRLVSGMRSRRLGQFGMGDEA